MQPEPQNAFDLMLSQMLALIVVVLSLFLPSSPLLAFLNLPGMVIAGIGFVIFVFGLRDQIPLYPRPSSPEGEKPLPPFKPGGIYRAIRHPIYLGLIVTALGVALSVGSLWSLGAVAALAVFFYFKSRLDEKRYLAIYPEYSAYQQKTGGFFPRWLRR